MKVVEKRKVEDWQLAARTSRVRLDDEQVDYRIDEIKRERAKHPEYKEMRRLKKLETLNKLSEDERREYEAYKAREKLVYKYDWISRNLHEYYYEELGKLNRSAIAPDTPESTSSINKDDAGLETYPTEYVQYLLSENKREHLQNALADYWKQIDSIQNQIIHLGGNDEKNKEYLGFLNILKQCYDTMKFWEEQVQYAQHRIDIFLADTMSEIVRAQSSNGPGPDFFTNQLMFDTLLDNFQSCNQMVKHWLSQIRNTDSIFIGYCPEAQQYLKNLKSTYNMMLMQARDILSSMNK